MVFAMSIAISLYLEFCLNTQILDSDFGRAFHIPFLCIIGMDAFIFKCA